MYWPELDTEALGIVNVGAALGPETGSDTPTLNHV
jgi:hypothetical protein